MVYSERLTMFPLTEFNDFTCLQSRSHDTWASFYSTTHEERFAYMPERCFETFPFPKGFEADPQLEEGGRAYYDFRAALMIRNNEGLTKTYNRFHDPDERSPDILKLREPHAAMDRAVPDAYGWTDLKPTCEFLLDYESDADEEDPGTNNQQPGTPHPPQAQALALPLARRLPRRSPRPPPGTQPPTGGGRAPERRCGPGQAKKTEETGQEVLQPKAEGDVLRLDPRHPGYSLR